MSKGDIPMWLATITVVAASHIISGNATVHVVWWSASGQENLFRPSGFLLKSPFS
jgi:hypothetical protein